MLRFRPATVAFALLVSSSSGCDELGGSEQSCTAIAHAAVVVSVVDTDGEPVRLEPGSVTYSLDGSDPTVLEAEFSTLDNPVAIYGSAGDYAITLAVDGFESTIVMAAVGVTDDGCHVATEERELVLVAD